MLFVILSINLYFTTSLCPVSVFINAFKKYECIGILGTTGKNFNLHVLSFNIKKYWITLTVFAVDFISKYHMHGNIMHKLRNVTYHVSRYIFNKQFQVYRHLCANR